ncbi:hypothetical protein NE865_05796 [Phthorimaea operculella]|nr:hypothetical protein NE865_05796 [Phthorimaea operculella]
MAKFFVIGHDCYVVYKDSDNSVQNMPSEFTILKQIAKPIKQLADMLPNHNVEVQLEMLGAKNVPMPRPTRMSFIHYRKPPHNQIQVFDHHKDELLLNHPTTPASMTVHVHAPPPPPQFHPPPPPLHLQPLQYQPQGFKEPVNFMNRAKYPPSGIYRRADTVLQGGIGAVPSGVYNGNTIQAGVPGLPLSTHEHDDNDRKPVYMADLKKALEDFEKKVFEKQNEINKDDPVEDAKKPLLKKDLWMALGLNHVAGCQQAHDHHHLDHTTVPMPVPRAAAVTPRIINLNSLGAADGSDSKIRRILEYLQGGIPGIKMAQPTKPNETNLQWLQHMYVEISPQVLSPRKVIFPRYATIQNPRRLAVYGESRAISPVCKC